MSNPEKFGGMCDGGEPIVGGEPIIAGASIPANTGTPAGGGDVFAVPVEYAEKGYAKDLKSIDDVWKKLDGSQALIGQKAVPTVESTSEQWDEHYKALGRPNDASGYNFNREGFSDDFKNSQNDEYDNAVKSIFHKAGLNQKQIDVIQPDVERLAVTMQEQAAIKKKETEVEEDKAFDLAADKVFGTNRDQILADSKVLLGELAPKGFEQKIAELPDDNLILLAGVLNNVKSKYINEDGSGSPGGGNVGAMTVDDLRLQAQTIMQTDVYRDSFNSKSTEKREEVKKIYEQIARLQANS